MPAERVKVADLDELPPGRGKTLTVFGRELTIYNNEGRIVATAVEPTRVAPAVGTDCDMPGRSFAVGPATSPDRLRSDERRVQVEVEGGEVFVVVEEST
jgi:nitrite reductase/ring-hydroxylating ferredoxin subunit